MKKSGKANWVYVAAENCGGVPKFMELVGISKSTAYEWIHRGNIAHVTVELAVKVSMISGIALEHLTGIPGLTIGSKTHEWWRDKRN